MYSLFITRSLEPGSPILTWAERSGSAVLAKSLLHFAPVRFAPPANQDWWFFYSPRAVAFAADRLALLPLPLPKIAAMGPGTARALMEHAYKLRPDFVGSGNPREVALAFEKRAAGQRVFFPRARQSRKTVQTLLANRLAVSDAVCYDNQAVSNPDFVHAGIYVFTSPLNARTYLMAHPLPADARVIAIGPSTAQALASFGVRGEVAAESSEQGVLELIATT